MSTRSRVLRVGLIVALAASWVVPAPAHAETVRLRGVSIAVDHQYKRVFVTQGDLNTVTVLDFNSQVVATIRDVPMASGVTIAGNRVYVAPYERAAIHVIDRERLVKIKTLRLPHPSSGSVAYARGRLWTAASWSSSFGSLMATNPKSGTTRITGPGFYDALIKTSPVHPNWLFVAETGLSPGSVKAVDISRRRPRIVREYPDDRSASNVGDFALSADGEWLNIAHGSPYFISEYSISKGTSSGVTYPTGPYPSAVDATDAGSGYVAAGVHTGTENLQVYERQRTTPTATHKLQEGNPRDVKFAPTGGRIFVLEQAYNSEEDLLHSLPAPASGQLSRTTLRASDTLVESGDAVRLTGRVDAQPSANNTVVLHAQPFGRASRPIRTTTVNSDGEFTFRVRPGRHTTYAARWAGDGTRLTSVSSPATVRLRLVTTLRMYGAYKRDGGYRYYRVGRRAPMVATTSPKRPGDSMVFRVQRRRDGAWRHYEAPRLRIPSDGTLEAAFITDRPGRYRIRAEYRSYAYSGDVSGWRYVRMTK